MRNFVVKNDFNMFVKLIDENLADFAIVLEPWAAEIALERSL